MECKSPYDLIIVGAGPCGLAAALVAAQNGLQPLLIDRAQVCGGQLIDFIEYPLIDIPGHPQIYATELVQKLSQQIQAVGVEVCSGGSVSQIESTAGLIHVQLPVGRLTAYRLLLSTGLKQNRLNIPGEDLIAWGSPHALIDRIGQRIIVVGGGDEACSSALSLAKKHAQVEVLVRTQQLRARKRFADALLAHPAIKVHFGESVVGITRDATEFVVLLASGKRIYADQAFIRIGMQVQFPVVTPTLARLAEGRIAVDEDGRTSVPGIFAGGDIVHAPAQRYVSIAMADGVKIARVIANELLG